MTHPETNSFASEIESKMGNFGHPDLSLNPQCMTISDWMKAQAEDKIIGDIIKMYKPKELQKSKETDSQEMRQFLNQRSKLLLRNRVLYHKNDTQEVDCPYRNYAISTFYNSENTSFKRML